MGTPEPLTGHRPRDSAYFDDWYAQMATSPAKDDLLRRHFGPPVELGSAGVVPWDALDEIAAALQVPAGGLIVDMACGRGAYGIELALRVGARLIGVDFSVVALDQARRTAAERLPAGRAEFRTGTLTSTDVPDGTADALLCTDSVQFAEPPAAAAAEFRRLLRRGGRVALTTWQATTPDDPRVGARLRALDVERELLAAGFTDVRLEQRPHWRTRERGAWEEAVAVRDDGSDLALASLQQEARGSLAVFDSLQRIIVVATAP